MKKGDEFYLIDYLPHWYGKFTLRRYIYQGTVHNGNIEVPIWHIALEWSMSRGDLRFIQEQEFKEYKHFFTDEKTAYKAFQERLEEELKEIKKK